jgi:D-tagatose-1,6-bisphosphate aldolase subunit GatZ/KbaZ
MTHPNHLQTVIRAQKSGRSIGIYSVCSVNRFVIDAAILQGVEDSSPVLIEATCNQVNQFGGYTGMTPEAFANYVRGRADAIGLPREQLILGGDHLGPYPFRKEAEESAMEKTKRMVADFVKAGCRKIHLDTSYRIAGDPGEPGTDIPLELKAERCAALCEAAELAAAESKGTDAPPVQYVIGTEVPAPGGSEDSDPDEIITSPSDLEETISATKAAFEKRGLHDAWNRVIAVVVEPGVEHGDQTVLEYDRSRVYDLVKTLSQYPGLVFEAHTTDYQTAVRLRQMVEDGFAILKTGQSQTAMAREAVFMLAKIESELTENRIDVQPSRFEEVLDTAMTENPAYWSEYYSGSNIKLQRRYSFYDRQRYYWPTPSVEAALDLLIANLREIDIPLALLSQYLPEQYKKVRLGILKNDPERLLLDRIMDHLREYSYAVGTRNEIGAWWTKVS